MKALSLKQPYAELVVSGKKTIEIRKWNTKFRGEFLVHASMNEDKAASKRLGLENLPKGMIIGKATLVKVKKYETKEEFEKDAKKHLATIDYGRHGFILKNAKRTKPVKAKGKLNFWEYP